MILVNVVRSIEMKQIETVCFHSESNLSTADRNIKMLVRLSKLDETYPIYMAL